MEKIKTAVINKRKIAGTPKLFIPFLGLVFVIAVFAIITRGEQLTVKNLPVLVSEIYSIGLGCAGVLFLMSTGNLDLSLTGIVAASAAVAATFAGNNSYLVLIITIVFGLVIGFINGILFGKLGIPSFITTLSMSFLLGGLTRVLAKGYLTVPYELKSLDRVDLKIGVLIFAFIIVYIVFTYTPFGKQCKAIGALTEAARQSGVNVPRIKVITFIISGLFCGLTAFFILARTTTTSTTTGQGLQFNVLIAMLVGGLSLNGGWTVKFRAVPIGALIMAFISNGMSLAGIQGATQQFIKAFLFVIVVAISFDRTRGEVDHVMMN